MNQGTSDAYSYISADKFITLFGRSKNQNKVMMFLINKIDRFNCFGGLEDEISSQYNINKKQIENIFDAFIQKGFIKKKDASSKVQYMFNPEFAHKCDYMDDYYKLKSQYDNA